MTSPPRSPDWRALAEGELDAPPHLRRAAVLAAADLLARADRPDEAGRLLDTLASRPCRVASAAPDGDPALRLARARVLLATKIWEADAVARLGEELVADATRAADGQPPSGGLSRPAWPPPAYFTVSDAPMMRSGA